MPQTQQAIDRIGELILVAIGNGEVDDLRVHPTSKKFRIPSASHPYHNYLVHITDSNKRNSCTCDAHKRKITRPCKHVLALKNALGN